MCRAYGKCFRIWWAMDHSRWFIDGIEIHVWPRTTLFWIPFRMFDMISCAWFGSVWEKWVFFVINSIFGKFQFLANFNLWWNFLKTGIWTFFRNFHHGMIPLVSFLDKSSVFEKFQRIQPDPSRLMRCLGSIL